MTSTTPISKILDFGSTTSLETTRSSSHLSTSTKKRIKLNNEQTIINETILNQVKQDKLILESTIDSILSGQPLPHSYSQLYILLERLCKFKHIEQSKLVDIMYDKIEQSYNSINLPTNNIESFLNGFEEWYAKLTKLSQVFIYLDRNYLYPHPIKKTILEYAMSLIIDDLLTDGTESCTKLLDQQSELMLEYRQNGYQGDLCRNFTKLLVRLNQVDDKFEFHNRLLEDTTKHYEELRDDEYTIQFTINAIYKEIDFWKFVGKDGSFINELFLKLRWLLIFSNFNEYLQYNIGELLTTPKYLKILYEYCSHTDDDFGYDSISTLVYQWGMHVQYVFHLIIDETNDVISELVSQYQSFKTISDTYFKDNDSFEFEIRNGLSKIINKDTEYNVSIILQLCKYCELYFKNKTQDDFQTFKNKVLQIFKAINNKNDFFIAYKKDLFKRLLMNKNLNLKEEEELANSFILLTGETELTISLQIMFQDIKKSKEMTFVNDLDIDFNSLVLDSRYWPDIAKSKTDILLPPPFKDLLTNFNQYYQSISERHNNQILDWNNYKLHQVVIDGNFNSGKIEINCNLLQAAIIVLFNEKESYTFEELKEELSIDEKLLIDILHSFEKYPIITKNRGVYVFNEKFTDRSNKIKLPRIKESRVVEDKTRKLIEINRSEEYKASIVKIMKQSKELHMVELLNSSIEYLQEKRPVDVKELKLSIQQLIDTEYLKVENDTVIYIP
ncbi:unnamed protein product [Candida verbasci]|uniref:Cullin family profile domain-containing protein n=1 Tax=Candida verbasci TaxID=1227364 RepID=A0A9W4TY32_9ASCO|nr:unnamed protein product [Candida verbasci]